MQACRGPLYDISSPQQYEHVQYVFLYKKNNIQLYRLKKEKKINITHPTKRTQIQILQSEFYE